MKKKSIIVSMAIVLTVSLLVVSSFWQPEALQEKNSSTLKRPLFLTSIAAESNDVQNIGNKLDEEAGIAAYYKASAPINLQGVKNLFTTIEWETEDYVLGAVPLQDYPERWHPHIYAHKDGWLVAYYLGNEPASRMADLLAKDASTSTLEKALSLVAAAGGVPFGEVTYYDFRYPNATHVMIAIEDSTDPDDYMVTLPSDYAYYELSWATHDKTPGWYLDLDGVRLEPDYSYRPFYYGTLTISQLLPDTPHTFELYYNDTNALVIIYRVVQ